jgi:hypothetical protein
MDVDVPFQDSPQSRQPTVIFHPIDYNTPLLRGPILMIKSLALYCVFAARIDHFGQA